MARALIVGCGCRGRALGRRLLDGGWQVRGTSRSASGRSEIEAAGLEAAEADPALLGTVLDHVADATVVVWLLGSATGDPADVGALHTARLPALMEGLVDTPVRGVVAEARGTVDARDLQAGADALRHAAERWRFPVALLEHDPSDHDGWPQAAADAVTGVLRAAV
ncbi:MAG: hypothetical protein ACR2NA_07395 [Solirubrobacterales bacterium]